MNETLSFCELIFAKRFYEFWGSHSAACVWRHSVSWVALFHPCSRNGPGHLTLILKNNLKRSGFKKLAAVDLKYIAFMKAQEEKLKFFLKDQSLKGITYFAFNRFFDTGEALLLSTNTDVLINRFAKETPLVFLPYLEFIKANRTIKYMLVNSDVPGIIWQEHHLFGHGHALHLFQFHKNHYDVFSFVTNGITEKEHDLLSNIQLEAKHAAQDFLLTQATLIKKMERIELPKSMQVKLRRFYYQTQAHLHLRQQNTSVTLAPREIEAMVLSCDGNQSKEAARIMGIKPKAYENYLYRVGQKLGGVGRYFVQIARENHLIY